MKLPARCNDGRRRRVRQNKLRAVSREIGLLTRIVSLKLSQNKIAVLPDDLGRLCAMQVCFLEENDLRALPATMQTCTALKVLDVSKNRITMLPTGLWRCGRITKINTYDNPLRLPPEVVSLGAAPILATLRALNTAETDGVLRLEGLQLRSQLGHIGGGEVMRGEDLFIDLRRASIALGECIRHRLGH